MRAGVRIEVSRGCAGPLADSAGRWRLGRGSVTVFGHVLVLLDTQRGVLTDCEGQVGEKRLAGLRVIQIEHGHMMGGSERDRQRLLGTRAVQPNDGLDQHPAGQNDGHSAFSHSPQWRYHVTTRRNCHGPGVESAKTQQTRPKKARNRL